MQIYAIAQSLTHFIIYYFVHPLFFFGMYISFVHNSFVQYLRCDGR